MAAREVDSIVFSLERKYAIEKLIFSKKMPFFLVHFRPDGELKSQKAIADGQDGEFALVFIGDFDLERLNDKGSAQGATRGEGFKLAQWYAREVANVILVSVHRMAGKVKAKELFFALQKLTFRRWLKNRRRELKRLFIRFDERKEVKNAKRLFFLIARGTLKHRLDASSHGIARPTSKIKSSRFDERFDRFFTDLRFIDALDQIKERGKRTSSGSLSDDFIETYLDAAGAAVLGSVGAYQIEGLGVHLFEKVDGQHAVIMGLPLQPLIVGLRGLSLLRG